MSDLKNLTWPEAHIRKGNGRGCKLSRIRYNGSVEADEHAVQPYASGGNSDRSSVVKGLEGFAA